MFIATSLDGFIAERDGGVDWLFTDGDYGYAAFFDSIETLIMGRRTYEQVLGFGEWPYGEKPTYVFTRGAPGGDHPHVEFVSGEAGALVEELRRRTSGDIWLVGGAALVSAFREQGLIDEYILLRASRVAGGWHTPVRAPAAEGELAVTRRDLF